MFNVIRPADLGSGFLSRTLGVGGSVASARATFSRNLGSVLLARDLRQLFRSCLLQGYVWRERTPKKFIAGNYARRIPRTCKRIHN